MSKRFLSKTNYLRGLQCPKLLWTHYKSKKTIPEVSPGTQAIFDQGHKVGDLAKELFPDGIDVEWDQNFLSVLKQSRELLNKRKPLFEAGFMSNRTYARVDVLVPAPRNKWDIIEVKSGTSVGDINYHDVAFQRYCYEGAGVSINKCYLMHINNQYVRHGEIDLAEIFTQEDITAEVDELLPDVPGKVEEMLKVIARRSCPDVDIGKHCDDPYECVLKDVCWKRAWKHDDNVFTLPNARGRDWGLYRQGILRNSSIPDDFPLSDKQQIQVDAESSGTPHVDKAAIKDFLGTLTYPLHFLDFETFGMGVPIPMLDDSRPYQQIPFQFSLHIQREPGSNLEHISWLWDGNGDPRPEFMKQLKKSLGHRGSIVVYNQSFECTRLRECAELLPGYAGWLKKTLKRVVDLLAPFRSFAVYHPDQHGSASIKAVLPAWTGKGYDDLDISDGGQASDEFMRITYGEAGDEERKKVCSQLEEYCGLDTMGMVDILGVLHTLL